MKRLVRIKLAEKVSVSDRGGIGHKFGLPIETIPQIEQSECLQGDNSKSPKDRAEQERLKHSSSSMQLLVTHAPPPLQVNGSTKKTNEAFILHSPIPILQTRLFK